jgi:hypothetical protein
MKGKLLLLAGIAVLISSQGMADDVGRKLSSADLKPYDQANYPKTFAKFGEKFVLNEIQLARVAGAQAMARDENCDRVLFSDLSDKSTRDNVVVFVDCANGYRIWHSAGRVLRTAKNPPIE